MRNSRVGAGAAPGPANEGPGAEICNLVAATTGGQASHVQPGPLMCVGNEELYTLTLLGSVRYRKINSAKIEDLKKVNVKYS